MKYTKILNSILCGVVAMASVSCVDFLTEVPKSSFSPDTYYNNDLEARIGINGIYNSLANNYVTGYDIKYVPTDLVMKPSWSLEEGLGNYTFSSTNNRLLKLWKNHFLAIKDCNAPIDAIEKNREKIPSADRFIGEGRGVRAFLYFDLVRWYGDVPLIKHAATSPDTEELAVSRNSRKEIFEFILEDLEFAAKHAPSRASKEYQYGRFNQEAALALTAKVHLYIASITERDGEVILKPAKEHYKLAMDFAKQAIDRKGFELTSYYPDAFTYRNETKAHEEVMFSSVHLTGDNTGAFTGMIFGIQGQLAQGGSWGMASSTDFHRSIYEPSDSIRRLWNCPRVTIQSNGTLKGWDYPQYYQNLDPAKEATDGTRFSIGKFRRYPLDDVSTYNYQNFGMDEPLLRFADVLLIYAEAYNEFNGDPGVYTPSSSLSLDGSNIQSAYDAVNVVRKRARTANVGPVHEDILPRSYNFEKANLVDDCVPDWRSGFFGYYSSGAEVYSLRGYTSDYAAFRGEILWERAREFVGETTDRWCDLTRRGELVERLQDVRTTVVPSLGVPERGLSFPSYPENVKEYHQLLPVPQSEIDSNKKLTQNPNY